MAKSTLCASCYNALRMTHHFSCILAKIWLPESNGGETLDESHYTQNDVPAVAIDNNGCAQWKLSGEKYYFY